MHSVLGRIVQAADQEAKKDWKFSTGFTNIEVKGSGTNSLQ